VAINSSMNTKQAIAKKFANRSYDELLDLVTELTIKNNRLNLYFFGARKERFYADPEGLKLLFNEAEEVVDTATSEQEERQVEEPSEKKDTDKKKPRGKRKPLPDHLPREESIVDLPSEEKFCKQHGVALVKIGEERIEKLDIVPSKAFVAAQIFPRYKCPCCDELKVFKASAPPSPIPKGFASPGLLAYVATQKYVDGLPLARQEKIFQRASIDLDRTTLARWMIKASDLASPLVNLIHDDLKFSGVVNADETRLQVLSEPNKPAESTSYMWCLARSGPDPLVLFRYYDNRSKRAGADLLGDFKGTLVADAYKVYASLQDSLEFTLAGCMAHARRHFWDAEKAAARANSCSEKSLAAKALMYIKALYAIEAKIKGSIPKLVLDERAKQSEPILLKFHEWLVFQRDQTPPRSPIGKAINYALLNWKQLTEFSRDGRVPIDNNFMEGHIRPFAIGRKAWLFAATPAGAHASANLYSLVESAKANGIEPFDYLQLIFKELPTANTQNALERLLPHNARKFFELRPYSSSQG
jgi:transposase